MPDQPVRPSKVPPPPGMTEEEWRALTPEQTTTRTRVSPESLHPEPLGTCPLHGDYWTEDCTRCDW